MDARSISGLVIMLNGGVVLAKSSTQKLVSTSTTEAEYVSMSDGTKQLMFVSNLAVALNIVQQLPIVMFEDNTSAIAIANGPVASSRTRHLHIRQHYIREQIAKGYVIVVYCPTEDMIADTFTKPLDRVKFVRFRDMLLGNRAVMVPYRVMPARSQLPPSPSDEPQLVGKLDAAHVDEEDDGLMSG